MIVFIFIAIYVVLIFEDATDLWVYVGLLAFGLLLYVPYTWLTGVP